MGIKPQYSFYGQSTKTLPSKDRKCTDIFCAVVFILVTLGGLGTGFYGLMNGNLKNIGQPYDTDGNACGVDNLAEFGFLFFNTPQNTNLTLNNVCVKSCPDGTNQPVNCHPNSNFAR